MTVTSITITDNYLVLGMPEGKIRSPQLIYAVNPRYSDTLPWMRRGRRGMRRWWMGGFGWRTGSRIDQWSDTVS